MKVLLLSMIVLLSLVGCNKGEVKPDPIVKPPVVDPTPTPSPTPTGPWYSQWDPNQEFCKPEGKHFDCGNPVWYGLKGCKPDSDGDNHAEGTAYFSTLAEIEAMAEKQNVTVRVKMKDGTFKQFGIGFAAPCSEL